MTPTHKLLALVLSVAVVGGVAFAAAGSRSDGGRNAGDGDRQAQQVQTSDIWEPGTSWTVTVRQDGSPITATGQGGVYEVPYHFRVEEAPAAADGAWIVSAKQDGAEGPWADGYRLFYVADERGGFVLREVALAGEQERKVAAKHARAIVGDAFPLERRVTKTPKDRSVKEPVSPGGAGGDMPPPPPPM